ncbi:MAG: helix-turn-helix transcriptional regulator [Verrucomicrobia bacterium]|nr:helix-turn-helix transcriptional regulator [Verrucomicrobiota bacterium]
MTFDYGAETPSSEFVNPPTLLNCIGLPSGRVKLLNFQAKLSDVWQCADVLPLHSPKQHVVCLHHFNKSMKLDRSLDGRTRREITGKGDVAFLPADVPTMLRPVLQDQHQVLSYSYLVVEPGYLAEMAIANGISRQLEFIPRFAAPDPLLHEITAALTALPAIPDPADKLFIETVLNAACAQLLRKYAKIRHPLSGPPRLTNDQLSEAINYIHQNLGESLDLSSVARAAGLSVFHFARLFKEATGETPFRFVTRARIQLAKGLLRKTRLPISEIAERVGYRTSSHFSSRFRVISGCSPDTYRRQAHPSAPSLRLV